MSDLKKYFSVQEMADRIAELESRLEGRIVENDLLRARLNISEATNERLRDDVDKALVFGYYYRQSPHMRGSSLHACRLVWKEQQALAVDEK